MLVLPLDDKKETSAITTEALDFLGVEFDSKPHQFYGVDIEESTNVMLSIPGIIFRDKENRSVLATPLTLPDDLTRFLAGKGYRILLMSFP